MTASSSDEMKKSLARFRVEPRPGTPQDFAKLHRIGIEEVGGRDHRRQYQAEIRNSLPL